MRAPSRPQAGARRAYLAGFEVALEGGADLMLEMDLDFSHDLADLPRLIAAAEADLVLGSRYVPGGGVTNRDSCGARSRAGARRTPGILLDPGGPDRRLQVLQPAGARGDRLDAVHADGYGFQIELTYRAVQGASRWPRCRYRFASVVSGSRR